MQSEASDILQSVVNLAQTLLADSSDVITPDLISQKLDLIVKLNPKYQTVDRQRATDELIRRSSIWIGRAAVLKNDEGHLDWLNAARKQDWRYWQRYHEFQEQKLPLAATTELDEVTDKILALLEDPLRDGEWDRRGLVVGHVQSGKTGNYTGLVCKAADAGYKIIIVLAGVHNNLRSQTQIRLDEGFLGYEPNLKTNESKIVGVGIRDNDVTIRPNSATDRSDKGDFVARNLAITPEARPWLFVIKKNKSVLERLLRWIRSHVADSIDPVTGKKIVTKLPLLIIDDEADHASVDTGEQVFDEHGNPDEEHEPKTINRLIRQILMAFARRAYVGYTATPFANIFIHDRGHTTDEGPDLFPSSFIVSLSAPSNYIGPAKVFGKSDQGERIEGLPLLRPVSDFTTGEGTGWMPTGHKKEHMPVYSVDDLLPPSLRDAIHAFLLATAVRYLRGQREEHSSMLIHVTRFTLVQQHVFHEVKEYVRHVRQRLSRGLGSDDIIESLKLLWQQDFAETSDFIRSLDSGLDVPENPSWDQVLNVVSEVVSDVEVRTINGTAKDALDYANRSNTGLKVIVIGGDKLSRGLTLEGLTVSYFLRASQMYDTLMQMGRWFGYRPSYIDLCRLYTPADLIGWFRHITDAAEELRQEFDLMDATGGTPRDYGLKVQSHPELDVTSRGKMSAARTLLLSFSGDLVETVSLPRDDKSIEHNLAATRRLIQSMPNRQNKIERFRDGKTQTWQGYYWSDVPSGEIIDFLASYRTHKDAWKVNSRRLGDFVTKMNSVNELTGWSVALIGGSLDEFELAEDIVIRKTQRAQTTGDENRYSVRRLLSPRDEAIDFDDPAWCFARSITKRSKRKDPAREETMDEATEPNGPAIRHVRGKGGDGVPAHPDRGLLLLYALDQRETRPEAPANAAPIIAFGISFPASESGVKVEYEANNVLWEEYSSFE